MKSAQGMARGDLATISGIATMVSFGAASYILRQKLAGREVDTSPQALLAEGIDRSGVLAWLMDGNNIIEKMTRGRVGMSALLGKAPQSRYASRGVAGSLGGVSVDTLDKIFQITGSVSQGDISKSDVKAMRRLLPMQNIFYLGWLFDSMEDELNGKFVKSNSKN